MQTSLTRTTHEVSILGFRARVVAPPAILRQVRPLLPIAPAWAATADTPPIVTYEVTYGAPH